MSLVVTGTDTGVGKTVACAVLLARYGRRFRLAYWKPVATGAIEERDAETVRRWAGRIAEVLPETYLFDPPVSPHLAAERAGAPIDPERILEDLVRHGLANARRNLVIEGAGGVLVPLTSGGYLLRNLFADLHLPCLLVARSTLGTINHTLLSLEALRAGGIEVAGVALVGPRDRDNRRAIERFGRAEVVGEVDWMSRPGPRAIERAARRFDTRGRLRRYLEA